MKIQFSYVTSSGKTEPLQCYLPETTTPEGVSKFIEDLKAWYMKYGSKVVDVRVVEGT